MFSQREMERKKVSVEERNNQEKQRGWVQSNGDTFELWYRGRVSGFQNNYGSFSFKRPFDSDDKPLHTSLPTLEIQFKKAQQTLRELVLIPVSGEGRLHLAAQFNQIYLSKRSVFASHDIESVVKIGISATPWLFSTYGAKTWK